jgi:excinuclease ABC subunit A
MDANFQQLLLYGSDKKYEVVGENRFGKVTSFETEFEGFVNNLERRYRETNSDFIRREIGQFMHKETCPTCHGDRLKKEALAVHVDGKNIAEVTQLTIEQSLTWIDFLQDPQTTILNQKEQNIAQSILKEIHSRLHFLNAVGLNYLTISREAGSLLVEKRNEFVWLLKLALA